MKTAAVALDDIENFDKLTRLEKYDVAIARIASDSPIRICDNEKISGAATLGSAIGHDVPAMYRGKCFCRSISHLTVDFETVLKHGILRCIMVKEVNMTQEHYNSIADLWHRLKHCEYVELIPYHAYAGSKMLELGKEDNGNPEWIPTDNLLKEAKELLRAKGVKLK